eukprot:TRINITY_DN22362_c0_g1_i1.p1 TRINITY_DN22362_c0_g1~~TRINITY_DN22362_c0_g1_i1.p1  ORF type:complete len:164 (+),score=28.23 TRINITY_DN22362_c0_g1_i1:52-543(+)
MSLAFCDKLLTSPLFAESTDTVVTVDDEQVFSAIAEYVSKREKEPYIDPTGEDIETRKTFVPKPILRHTNPSELFNEYDLTYCDTLLEKGVQMLLKVLGVAEKLQCVWLVDLLTSKCAIIVRDASPAELESMFERKSTDTTHSLTSRKLSWMLPLVHNQASST